MRAAGWSAAAAVTAVGYASLIERRQYTLREFTLPLLAEGSAPLRVLHISDLHLSPTQHDKIAWLKSLAFLEPDVVINTGDNVGRVDAIPALGEALGPLLRSTSGVFVDGSNDLFAPIVRNPFAYLVPRRGHASIEPGRAAIDTDAIHGLFGSGGWSDLNDAESSLTVAGRGVFFVGTRDAHLGLADLGALRARDSDVRAAHDRGELVVGVTHAPYRGVLDALVETGVDLIFAGHTHGGQVRVPGIGALTSNCDLPLAQARGLSTWTSAERAVPLHVSAGLGTSIYAPVRFACRPEVSLITLSARG